MLALPPHSLEFGIAVLLRSQATIALCSDVGDWGTTSRLPPHSLSWQSLPCRRGCPTHHSRAQKPAPEARLSRFVGAAAEDVTTPCAAGSEASLGFVSADSCRPGRKTRAPLPRQPPPPTPPPQPPRHLGRHCLGQFKRRVASSLQALPSASGESGCLCLARRLCRAPRNSEPRRRAAAAATSSSQPPRRSTPLRSSPASLSPLHRPRPRFS